MRRLAFALGALVSTLLTPLTSDAAPPWVDRGMTLERHVFAGDVGIGIGHTRFDRGPLPDATRTGAGLNLEGAFGITEKVELGLRTGIRIGDDGRFTQADTYGRTLWTETYGTRTSVVANPEVKVRWALYQGDVVEVGLDWRLYLPFETNSRIGGMFGVPLAFHLGRIARIDTGAYLPTLFYDPAIVLVTIPGYFWFQVSDKVWLGPMTSLRHRFTPSGGDRTDLLFGFGLGIQVASAVDLKTMVLFPNIDDGTNAFGAGFGVQFRVE
jgi:hypothetical protein